MGISELLAGLYEFRGANAFNQYAEIDPALDVPGAERIRCDNLIAYMDIFRKAKVVLVGEAPSFHGCRFSGIPFMSEELLTGNGILPWAKGVEFRRTSLREKPMSEHSASIVWETLGKRRDIILWNAFPWYPHKAVDNSANRKPTKDEEVQAAEVLRAFLGLHPKARVYAVGRTAEHALNSIGIEADYIRHPAMGGKPEFVKGIAKL